MKAKKEAQYRNSHTWYRKKLLILVFMTSLNIIKIHFLLLGLVDNQIQELQLIKTDFSRSGTRK